jgi:hypothetical protein
MHRLLYLCFVALLFVPNGAWAQGEPLGPEFRVNTYTPDDQINPSVASDSSGNFVVVWSSYSYSYFGGGDLGVFGQRYASSGAPLGPEFRVNTYTTHTQFAAAVASDSSGNFVVVWYSYSQAGSHVFQDVFGQRFASTGAPVGPEFRVNTYTTDGQLYPAVASDASGNFVVVWYSYSGDGSYKAVIGQRFASTGAPVGPEFRVNTYTTDRQGLPAVASDAAGNFVVVWNSLNQDGSSYGVFGQRYSQIVPVELMHFRVE